MGKIFDNLRIQGRMHIFEKMSQSALNQVLTLPDYRTQKMLQIPLKIIDLQNDLNILVAKQWTIIISVPMSYVFLRIWPSKCRRSRPGGRPQVNLRSASSKPQVFTNTFNKFASGRSQINHKSTWKSTSSAQVSILTHNKWKVATFTYHWIRRE